jgi:hypothetical protein
MRLNHTVHELLRSNDPQALELEGMYGIKPGTPSLASDLLLKSARVDFVSGNVYAQSRDGRTNVCALGVKR